MPTGFRVAAGCLTSMKAIKPSALGVRGCGRCLAVSFVNWLNGALYVCSNTNSGVQGKYNSSLVKQWSAPARNCYEVERLDGEIFMTLIGTDANGYGGLTRLNEATGAIEDEAPSARDDGLVVAAPPDPDPGVFNIALMPALGANLPNWEPASSDWVMIASSATALHAFDPDDLSYEDWGRHCGNDYSPVVQDGLYDTGTGKWYGLCSSTSGSEFDKQQIYKATDQMYAFTPGGSSCDSYDWASGPRGHDPMNDIDVWDYGVELKQIAHDGPNCDWIMAVGRRQDADDPSSGFRSVWVFDDADGECTDVYDTGATTYGVCYDPDQEFFVAVGAPASSKNVWAFSVDGSGNLTLEWSALVGNGTQVARSVTSDAAGNIYVGTDCTGGGSSTLFKVDAKVTPTTTRIVAAGPA